MQWAVTTAPKVARAIQEDWLARLQENVPGATAELVGAMTACLTDAYDDVERYLGRSLLGQVIAVLFDSGDELERAFFLPMAPVRSVDSVKSRDSDNAETVVDSADYRLEGISFSAVYLEAPCLVQAGGGFSVEREKAGLEVVATCGYGDGATGEHASIPRLYRRALIRKATTLLIETVPWVTGTTRVGIETMEDLLKEERLGALM